MRETITVIQARGGRALAKRIAADGTVQGYDRVRSLNLLPQPVDDLVVLRGLLAGLQSQTDCAVVRGERPVRCSYRRALRSTHI